MSSPYLNCSYAGRRRKRAAIGILFYKFVLYGSRRKGEDQAPVCKSVFGTAPKA